MDQQLVDERRQLGRQLGEEHAEILQDLRAGQRLAGQLRANAAAVDQVQLAVATQQIVQVQVVLPQAARVQAADGAQRLAQYRLLRSGQQRLLGYGLPDVAEADRLINKLEQQPATLAHRQAFGQQRGGIETLLAEQTCAFQLAGVMALGPGADQQLGQHAAALPLGLADVALAGQHAQQAEQAQLATRQLDAQWQRRAAPGRSQLVQAHRLPSPTRLLIRAPRRKRESCAGAACRWPTGAGGRGTAGRSAGDGCSTDGTWPPCPGRRGP
ncbi:hypothetical protein D3C75_769830 [compost metagenome]